MYADTDLIDIDGLGIEVEGLSLGQLRKVIAYYKSRSHDLDLEHIDLYTRGI